MQELPAADDLAWLRRFRKAVVAEWDGLEALVQEELGKPGFETMTSEFLPLLAACRWHEKHARRLLRPRRQPRASWLQLGQTFWGHRVPLGEVAIIATWNYPLQLLGVQLIQAVLGGNRVTVKPSERSPRSQGRLLELAREAGLSEARLSWVGAERQAGEALLRDRRFDHVVFTGSTAVGRQIAQKLAESLTPSTLELSGMDSALVLSDADEAMAAASIAFAVALNGGATCLVPRRVIVVQSKAEAFCRKLREAIGDGPTVDGYTQVDRGASGRLATEAARAGGRWLDLAMGDAGWDRPWVVVDPPSDSPLARGEHFGPALAVLTAENDEDALQQHQRFGQRLVTAVFSSGANPKRAELAALGGSIVTLNDCIVPTGNPAVALAGCGPSGWGVSRGREGLLAMTRPVNVSRTSRWLRPPLQPPTPKMQQRMARFVKWFYG